MRKWFKVDSREADEIVRLKCPFPLWCGRELWSVHDLVEHYECHAEDLRRMCGLHTALGDWIPINVSTWQGITRRMNYHV